MVRSHQNHIRCRSDAHRIEWVLYPFLTGYPDPIYISSASDVCECCIVDLWHNNLFCPLCIRSAADVKYFWCERAIRQKIPIGELPKITPNAFKLVPIFYLYYRVQVTVFQQRSAIRVTDMKQIDFVTKRDIPTNAERILMSYY